MVKAHSLLYAIYICLLISIVCGGLLCFSNLYNQLNLHYNLQEELYIHNQSLVNFALGNQLDADHLPEVEERGIKGEFFINNHGLLTVLKTSSFVKNDTVKAIHMVGSYDSGSTAIHLANFSQALAYSGKVSVIGDAFLPTTTVESSFVLNEMNHFSHQGGKKVSEIQLPKINPSFEKIFEGINAEKTSIHSLEKIKDSLYFNSFHNPTKEINIASLLSNAIFKGNFILRNNQSITVSKTAVLEDVILIAPEIIFEEGFSGNVQAFATKKIELKEGTVLNYPSVVCVFNKTNEESTIKINEKCTVQGAVVLFGNPIHKINANSIEIAKEGTILGDIYCTGKLDVKSDVWGSVYTNRFFMKTLTSSYDNIISNIEINCKKRPEYFISIPLFEPKKTSYGILKKAF